MFDHSISVRETVQENRDGDTDAGIQTAHLSATVFHILGIQFPWSNIVCESSYRI